MCRLGNIPLPQREILRVTGHLLKPGYQALHVNKWGPAVPRMLNYLPQSQAHIPAPMQVAFPLQLWMSETRTGIRQSRQFNFMKNYSWRNCRGWSRTKECRTLSFPPTSCQSTRRNSSTPQCSPGEPGVPRASLGLTCTPRSHRSRTVLFAFFIAS